MKERNAEQKGARRASWLFSYDVSTVRLAAREQLTYHEARITYWTDEREKAVAAVKAAGFEVREYEVTGGKDVQVVVDMTHTARLGVCSGKLREHQAKAKEFRQWVAVLDTQPGGERIDLDMEDALYFGVAKQEPQE